MSTEQAGQRALDKRTCPFDAECDMWAVLRAWFGIVPIAKGSLLALKKCYSLHGCKLQMTQSFAQFFEELGGLGSWPLRCFLEINHWQLKEPQGFCVAQSCLWSG